MFINVSMDGSRIEERICTQQGWQDLGAWIEETADETIPLLKMWFLTHLVTYGWIDDLKALAKELRALLTRADLPVGVRETLEALAGVLKRRTKEDERIVVFSKEK